jgi:hypothetical protein
MSEIEEDDDCSPNYLTELFEILDVNKEHVKNEKSAPITEWVRQYKAICTEYDQRESEIVELIENFNDYTQECTTQLYNMSKKFIDITNQSPGETACFKDLLKDVKTIKKALQVNPEMAEYALQAKKLYSDMLKFKKLQRPLPLSLLQDFSERYEEFE